MNDYCSITVANHGLIRVIRSVSSISTHLLKKFINKFYLILLNSKISFDGTGTKNKSLEINSTLDCTTAKKKVRLYWKRQSLKSRTNSWSSTIDEVCICTAAPWRRPHRHRQHRRANHEIQSSSSQAHRMPFWILKVNDQLQFLTVQLDAMAWNPPTQLLFSWSLELDWIGPITLDSAICSAQTR